MVDASNSAKTADPVLFNKWEKFEDKEISSNLSDCATISVAPPADESRGAQVALLNGETQSPLELLDSSNSSTFKGNKPGENSDFERQNENVAKINEQNGSPQTGHAENCSTLDLKLNTEIQNRSQNRPKNRVISALTLEGAKDQNTNVVSKENGEGNADSKSSTRVEATDGDSSVETESIEVNRAANDQTLTTPENSNFSLLDKIKSNEKDPTGGNSSFSRSNNWISFGENRSSSIEKTTFTEDKPRESSHSNMALSQVTISNYDKNALVEEMFSPESDVISHPHSSTENNLVTTKSESEKQKNKPSNCDTKTAVMQTSVVKSDSMATKKNNAGNTACSLPQTWVNFDDDNTLLATTMNKKSNAGTSCVPNTSRIGDASDQTAKVIEKIQGQSTENGVNIKSDISVDKQPVTASVADKVMTNTDCKVSETTTSVSNSPANLQQWVSFEESSITTKDSENSKKQNSVITKTISTTISTSLSVDVVDNTVASLPSVSPTPSWVTFTDETKHRSELSNLSGAVPVQNGLTEVESTTPSPNPFLNAPKGAIVIQEQGVNPFKVPTEVPLSVVTSTNPFKPSEDVIGTVVNVSPFHRNANAVQPPGGLSAADLDILEGISSSQSSATNSVLTEASQTKGQPIKMSKKVVKSSSETKKPVSIVPDEKIQVENDISENEPVLDDLPTKSSTNSWTMLLRYPDKKKKIGSRDWKPVVIRLEGSTLQIYDEYELSAPFREIPLQACFAFSDSVLQKNHHHKVHTVKLEYVKYKESRKVRKGGDIEHIAIPNPIIKVGSANHLSMKQFIEAVSESLCTLPAYRDRGITYSHDEVFVDIDDTCEILSDENGAVLKQAAKVQIKLRAFLTGDPECQLVLNDVVIKEKEEARLRGELKPQRVHHWVKLRNIKFHKCVNPNAFWESHSIVFHPLDACTFELMRFRVPQTKQLPLLVKASLNVHNEQRVELKAEIQVCQDAKLAKYERNNVVFRFPIPDSWVPLFRTSKPFGGEKSIKSRKGLRAAGIKGRLKHSKCSIAASLGAAKYEPEYGAIMWRIDKLPLIQSKLPADAPQTLTCRLELPTGMDYPDNSYEPYAELSYDIGYVLVSDTTVIAVKVSNQNIPDKWVCYRSFYHHHIKMNVSRPKGGPIRDVGCSQQRFQQAS